mgnify:CR=1 FL=1
MAWISHNRKNPYLDVAIINIKEKWLVIVFFLHTIYDFWVLIDTFKGHSIIYDIASH